MKQDSKPRATKPKLSPEVQAKIGKALEVINGIAERELGKNLKENRRTAEE